MAVSDKKQVTLSIGLEFLVELEKAAIAAGAKPDPKTGNVAVQSVIMHAAAEKVNYTLTEAEKASVAPVDEEAKKAAAKAKLEADNAERDRKLAELRAKNRASATEQLAGTPGAEGAQAPAEGGIPAIAGAEGATPNA